LKETANDKKKELTNNKDIWRVIIEKIDGWIYGCDTDIYINRVYLHIDIWIHAQLVR
jgi:hypothetical protein